MIATSMFLATLAVAQTETVFHASLATKLERFDGSTRAGWER
jgi:hypothetical protein